MLSRLIRRPGVLAAIVIVAAIGYLWLRPRAAKPLSIAYVADRNVTLWSNLAQVRQSLAELHYGERVDVLRQDGVTTQVRTAAGLMGWIADSRQLMDSTLWQQSADLLTRARKLPVQALGHTKALSNVRVEPGRNALRVFQFPRGTPVVILQRAVSNSLERNPQKPSNDQEPDTKDRQPQKEDWLYVLRAENSPAVAANPISNTVPVETADASSHPNPASKGPVSGGPALSQTPGAGPVTPATPIAGWVLARFVELDLPGPVRDHATASNLHVVSWFELNRVPDGSGGEAPQYLVAGSKGGEGQPCDFTMLRVYTWGAARKRYETAYVESDLCGQLPIRVSASTTRPEFRFATIGENTPGRIYVMQQTSVRRLKEDVSRSSRRRYR